MIVVDASVGIKWLKTDEKGAEAAREIFRDNIEKRSSIIVPSLFFLEIANVLALTKKVTRAMLKRRIQFLNKSGLTVHSFSKTNLEEAAILAKQYSTTVYDMLYAVIAKELGCQFITADERFVEKTHFPFVKLLRTDNA
ncbi:hypothetical protein A2Z00_01950 [Candidatus Gottesmanbacteria bacterium RBG_13_45_10]|uniref:Ribonuclease VapC n=1 Tax=Candidatus Gottesmanbacteria bacterium RBG_13_45_10 TaxID=1798370 RepID=A0A1F5ZI70_9BACT|nr:MAG: hypothetical protein A2Z00_01950 [Candidatus Gottesmanbacteria bacterium RBG_13_45_10]